MSARASYLRAYTYQRAPLIFISPLTDADRYVTCYHKARYSFRRAAALFDAPLEPLSIPYEGQTLPGYFLTPSKEAVRRKTLIMIGGGDTFVEDLYFYVAPAAVARGYNVLSVDLPGQGLLPNVGLTWPAEAAKPLAAVIAYALDRADVDPIRLVAYGLSGGGYLIPRALTREMRAVAAAACGLVVDMSRVWSEPRIELYQKAERSTAHRLVLAAMRHRRPTLFTMLDTYIWRFDATSVARLPDVTQTSTLDPADITCPFLNVVSQQEYPRGRHPADIRRPRPAAASAPAQRSGRHATRRGRRRPRRRHQPQPDEPGRLRLVRRDARGDPGMTSLWHWRLPAAVNRIRRPEVYEEALINSGGAPVVLSVWHAPDPLATVVFLPGTMVHPLFYATFLDRLASEGFTVVGVHSQGHGKSPRTGAPLTFAALVRNARDAVSYAVQRFGRPVVVMGSSQGGMLAMAVAAADGRLAGVVAHNVLDPGVPEALHATRFPRWVAVAHRPLRRVLRVAGRLLPWVPVPVTAYLDLRKVCREPWTLEQFLTDPLALHRYPLRFIASLFTADMSGMFDGSVHCPVVVLASDGDQVFDINDTRRLFERLVAPHKKLVVFNLDRHLILNESVDAVLPRVAAEIAALIKPTILSVTAAPSG